MKKPTSESRYTKLNGKANADIKANDEMLWWFWVFTICNHYGFKF
jgi:hypothetical protein